MGSSQPTEPSLVQPLMKWVADFEARRAILITNNSQISPNPQTQAIRLRLFITYSNALANVMHRLNG